MISSTTWASGKRRARVLNGTSLIMQDPVLNFWCRLWLLRKCITTALGLPVTNPPVPQITFCGDNFVARFFIFFFFFFFGVVGVFSLMQLRLLLSILVSSGDVMSLWRSLHKHKWMIPSSLKIPNTRNFFHLALHLNLVVLFKQVITCQSTTVVPKIKIGSIFIHKINVPLIDGSCKLIYFTCCVAIDHICEVMMIVQCK